MRVSEGVSGTTGGLTGGFLAPPLMIWPKRPRIPAPTRIKTAQKRVLSPSPVGGVIVGVELRVVSSIFIKLNHKTLNLSS